MTYPDSSAPASAASVLAITVDSWASFRVGLAGRAYMAVDILVAITVALYAAEHLPQPAPHSYASDKSYHFTIVFAAREQIRKVAITITKAATR